MKSENLASNKNGFVSNLPLVYFLSIKNNRRNVFFSIYETQGRSLFSMDYIYIYIYIGYKNATVL